MTLSTFTSFTSGVNTSFSTELNDNFTRLKDEIGVPINGIIAWDKTSTAADSGTTDGTTANKLIQSGQNFTSTVSVGQIVFNSTDTTWSYVTAIDSDTQLSINDDIMVSGENFTIYTTPFLPIGFLECDGSVISDAESPINGDTLPDMNSGTKRFVRGSTTSGTTGGADTKNISHTHTMNEIGGGPTGRISGGDTAADQYSLTTNSGGSSSQDILPAYVEMVWIKRVK